MIFVFIVFIEIITDMVNLTIQLIVGQWIQRPPKTGAMLTVIKDIALKDFVNVPIEIVNNGYQIIFNITS